MKKMYQQPQTEEMEVRLQDVIQATAGPEGPSHSDGGGTIGGDNPEFD